MAKERRTALRAAAAVLLVCTALIGGWWLRGIQLERTAGQATAPNSATAPAEVLVASEAPPPEQKLGAVWDADWAERLVLYKLQSYNWQSIPHFCAEVCTPEHQVALQSTVRLGGVTHQVILTQSREESFGCHACGATLSVFDFVATAEGWRLARQHFAFASLGAYGSAGNEGLRFEQLGDDHYGLLVVQSHEGGGSSTNTAAWLFVGDDAAIHEAVVIGLAFDDGKGQDEEELTGWKGGLSFVDSSSTVKDIVVERLGLCEGVHIYEKDTLRFDAGAYRRHRSEGAASRCREDALHLVK